MLRWPTPSFRGGLDGKDPFAVKAHSKLSPRRIVYTALARSAELDARLNFSRYALPEVLLSPDPNFAFPAFMTQGQRMASRAVLLRAARSIHLEIGGDIVEVGCYRGVLTRAFAEYSGAHVWAVDPFAGYGAGEEELALFKTNIAGHNITHLAQTASEAKPSLKGKLCFAYLETVLDYVNTKFNAENWAETLIPGGLLAIYPSDLKQHSGTRKAAGELARKFELVIHQDNICIYRPG